MSDGSSSSPNQCGSTASPTASCGLAREHHGEPYRSRSLAPMLFTNASPAEQGQPLIGDQGHDVSLTFDHPQFERERSAQLIFCTRIHNPMDWSDQSYVNFHREDPSCGVDQAARCYVFSSKRLRQPSDTVSLSRHSEQCNCKLSSKDTLHPTVANVGGVLEGIQRGGSFDQTLLNMRPKPDWAL